jgi:hypothetical protein
MEVGSTIEQSPPTDAFRDVEGSGQLYVVIVAVGETKVATRVTPETSTAVEPYTSWRVYLHEQIKHVCS